MVLSLTASFSAFGIGEQPALISPQFVGTPGIDDIPFCIDEDVITDAEHTVRLRYLETEDNVAAFSNPDGSATMYYFSNPIKYTDIYGNTVDIDNTVETFGKLTDEYKFKTKSAPATTYLPATIGMGEDVKVEHNGFSVQIIPMSDRFAAGTTVASELKTGKDSAVLYSNVFGTGRSLKYTTLYNGVKEDIILNSYVANANSFNFIVKTNGLELAEIDGRYVIRDTLGIPMFELSPIFVYDSAEVPNSTGGTYTIEEIKPNDIYALTLTVDETWLSSATYPVTIDPTVTYNTDSGLEDAFQHPTNSLSTGSSNTLIIGNREGSVYRSFIKFPGLTEAIGDNIVTDANLYMKCYQYSIPRAFTLEMYGITSSWIENNYGPTLPYNVSTVSGIPTGTGSGYNGMTSTLNILPFVNAWLHADETASNVSTDNNGILFKMTDADEEINYYYAFYHSTEATNADDRPYVTISMSSFELPSTQQEGIRDNRFYWVSRGTSFLTQSVASLGRYPTPSARDYTNTAQRLLFTYVGSGKYRISTESSPTNYLTLNGNSLLFQAQSTSGNQLWYVGNTNGSSYYIINAADTTKSLTTNGTSVTCSTSSVTNWTFEKCPTFYSQDIGTINGHQYWDTTNLNNLYFTSYSTTKMFLANDSSSDIMRSGCVMSSFAMVLDNLNIKTSEPHIDFRVSMTNSNYLIPDPFTCTMANTAWKQITYDGTKYVASGYSSNPVLTIWGTISSNFSFSYKTDDFNITDNERYKIYFDQNNATTVKQKALMLAQVLEDNPAGVMLRVGNNNHTIVITKYKGYTTEPTNDKGWDDLFIVYDPAASTLSAGSGCIWSACQTYGSYKGLANATYITILTP